MTESSEVSEARALKRRMIGALVLLSLAVIFLPMLLDGSGILPQREERMPERPTLSVMDTETTEAATAVLSDVRTQVVAAHALPEEVSPAEQRVAATDESAPAAPVSIPAPVLPVAPSVSVTVAEKTPAVGKTPVAGRGAPSPLASAATIAPRMVDPADVQRMLNQAWTIQVAVLSHAENADKLVAALKAEGYPAYLRRQGDSIRVYVGPELHRDRAEAHLAGLMSSGRKGMLQKYVP